MLNRHRPCVVGAVPTCQPSAVMMAMPQVRAGPSGRAVHVPQGPVPVMLQVGGNTVSWTEAGVGTPAIFGPGTEFETLEDYFAPPLAKWGKPYSAMLAFLADQGWFEGLPVDERGILHVNVPFCAGFMECQILFPFLLRVCLGRPGVTGVAVFGADVAHMQGGNWDRKERYVANKYPCATLELRKMDLVQEKLPECSLAIGVHPEATRAEFWRDILANVVRSTRCGGVCVFATYFEVEFQAVLDKCRPLGVNFEVYENPHYKSHPMDMSPALRFLVVARVPQL